MAEAAVAPIIKNLCTQFLKERRKENGSVKSGAGRDEVKGVVLSIFPRRMCILHNQGNTLVFTGSETVKNWPSF